MKIIILGAGQVGGTLAEHLANEQNDITVVDTDGEKLRAAAGPSGHRHRRGGGIPPQYPVEGRRGRRRYARRRHQQRRDQHDGLPGGPYPVQHPDQDFPGSLSPVPRLPGATVQQGSHTGRRDHRAGTTGDQEYPAADRQPRRAAGTGFRRGEGAAGRGAGLPRRADRRPGTAGNSQAHAQGGHPGRRHFSPGPPYHPRGQYGCGSR